MSSSYQSSRSSATHRRAAPPPNANNAAPSGSVRQDVDPAPTPRPVFRFLGFGFIIFLVFLQFLPATHFRHPSDPLRRWTPFDDSTAFGATSDGNSSSAAKNSREDGMVHVVSWMDCLDLRLLAVLANSTLSSSRQQEVREIITTAISGAQFAGSSFVEVAPFIIPSVHQSLTKFIYISPNILMKGKVEDLIGTALSNYAIGAAEDCSRKLDMFVNSNVLDVIQRSASKPWVSETPYAKNACTPDLSVLLIDSTKLDGDFVDAFLWWSKVLNLNESGKNSAIVLALYNKYLKLSNSWSVTPATSSEMINNTRVIRYDIPNSVCSQFGSGATPQVSGNGNNIWKHYLPPMSDQILGS
ncbi:hypothetical protein I3760_09G147900 [Carya illinoinensis]|nr:hypothetical protein I3760_09G147900 [Carya illinoinensis]